MRHETPTEFSSYLQAVRWQRRLGVRELARKAGLSPSVLTRLEQGKTSPMPGTLKALALALDIPAGELFAAAGYMTPSELPKISTYLRVYYGNVPDETVARIEQYIQRLVDERGLDPNGPVSYEDETGEPSSN